MIPGWFPTKVVQMVLIGCISRSQRYINCYLSGASGGFAPLTPTRALPWTHRGPWRPPGPPAIFFRISDFFNFHPCIYDNCSASFSLLSAFSHDSWLEQKWYWNTNVHGRCPNSMQICSDWSAHTVNRKIKKRTGIILFDEQKFNMSHNMRLSDRW